MFGNNYLNFAIIMNIFELAMTVSNPALGHTLILTWEAIGMTQKHQGALNLSVYYRITRLLFSIVFIIFEFVFIVDVTDFQQLYQGSVYNCTFSHREENLALLFVYLIYDIFRTFTQIKLKKYVSNLPPRPHGPQDIQDNRSLLP